MVREAMDTKRVHLSSWTTVTCYFNLQRLWSRRTNAPPSSGLLPTFPIVDITWCVAAASRVARFLTPAELCVNEAGADEKHFKGTR